MPLAGYSIGHVAGTTHPLIPRSRLDAVSVRMRPLPRAARRLEVLRDVPLQRRNDFRRESVLVPGVDVVPVVIDRRHPDGAAADHLGDGFVIQIDAVLHRVCAGADGIRVAPATTGKYAQPEHKMAYEIIVPNSLNFNGEREFDIVKEGFAAAGVDVTIKPGGDSTAAYALETGDNCDAAKSTGYDSFDIAMWDWIGYVDPDFMLSVVTKGQWCSWSDTGWDSPEFDALPRAEHDGRPGGAQADRLGDAADDLRQLPLHAAR